MSAGHDAFVNQNFRLSNKQVAQYIQSMVDLESRNDIEELLLRFGEEPASGEESPSTLCLSPFPTPLCASQTCRRRLSATVSSS